MFKQLILTLLLVTGTTFASSVQAILIDFSTDAEGNAIEPAELFAATRPLTTTYTPLGITFAGGGALVDNDSWSATGFEPGGVVGYHSNAFFWGGAPVQASDTIKFASLQTSVSFLTAHGASPGQVLIVSAFDNLDNLLSTQSVRLSRSGQVVTIDGGHISRVSYGIQGGSGSFIIDDLNVVPIPSTIALLGIGFLGLGWSRRKEA